MKSKDQIIKDLKKENKRLKQLADRDFLTGLFNYRKLHDDLAKRHDLFTRYGVKTDVALFDIDDFKQYNDRHGHHKGDLILKKTAEIIQQSIRRTDKAYRLSGGADEFIILYAHHKDIEHMFDRITNALKKINIAVSYGASPICENVLAIVDKKMYEQKRSKKIHV